MTRARQLLASLLPVLAGVAVLAVTPISTDTAPAHMLAMGALLAAAILAAIGVEWLLRRARTPRFPWRGGGRWRRAQWWYLGLAAAVSYLLFPLYFRATGAHLNWRAEPGVWNVLRLFAGTNALGIWDELFFVCTCLALLRRGLPFWAANLLQAALFTTFLYELGFTSWGPLFIYPFALLQGAVFHRTESLGYIVAIHLTIDLVLFLALLELHHPGWVPIFVT